MNIEQQVIIWVLIFVRISMCLIFVPLFAQNAAPMRVKVIFLSAISLMFMLSGKYTMEIGEITDFEIFKGIFIESINGFSIGIAATLIMNAIYIAGHLIDMNMGFSMVSVLSAQSDAQIPITANFYYVIFSVLFLLTNAHHEIIDALYLSFNRVSLGELSIKLESVAAINSFISNSFELGFKIAFPIIMTILIANIVLGLLSKAMPGMNVFMVGMPFKILIGLLVVSLMLPVVYELFTQMLKSMTEFIYIMVGGFRN